MPTKAGKASSRHKFGGRNNGPARQRYWLSGRLRKRKVARLVRCCGMTPQAAEALWITTRRRVKRGGAA